MVLVAALIKGDLESVKRLVAEGVNVAKPINVLGCTPLL
jgi:hypothetical protein